MIPPNADQLFPPPFPTLNLSGMTLPSGYPSLQQQSIPNALLSSHVHLSHMLAIPAEPVTLAPAGDVATMQIRDHYVPQPVLAHHLPASGPSLQMHRLERGVPNAEAG